MKKIITLLVLFFAAATTTAQVWQNVGSPIPMENGIVWNTVVKVGPDGTPYVASFDAVKKFNGTDWENVGNLSFLPAVSLAINAGGTPYITSADDSQFNYYVKKFNGTVWENVGTLDILNDYNETMDIVINPSGTPYVILMDTWHEHKASVMKFNGTDWEYVGIPGFSQGQAYYRTLAFDAAGTPYVCFMDESFNYQGRVMKYNGNAWEPVGASNPTPESPYDLAFVMDASGRPVVASMDEHSEVRVVRLNGTEWEDVSPSGYSVGGNFKLAADASGAVYLFCPGADTGGQVLRLAGNTWEFVGAPGFTPEYLSSSSLTLDPSGTPYVAFTDYYSGYATGVMKLCNECVPLTAITSTYCGQTLSQLNSTITADPVANANKYRFRVTSGGTSQTLVRTSNIFRITMLAAYAYNTNYTIEVAANINGNWGEYGIACTVTTPGAPLTQLRSADCGNTIAGFNANIYADPVLLADGYRFRITNGANVQTIDRPNTYFRLNQLPSYNYGVTYTVDVAARVNGAYGGYGAACNITAPALPLRN